MAIVTGTQKNKRQGRRVNTQPRDKSDYRPNRNGTQWFDEVDEVCEEKDQEYD